MGDCLVENCNIKIPETLFQETLHFLENIPVVELERELQKLYKSIFLEFKRKQNAIRLRNIYALVIAAKSEGERQAALSNYLNEKQLSEQLLLRLSARLDSMTPGYAGLHLRVTK